MSVFPLASQPRQDRLPAKPSPTLSLAEQLREAERRCAAAEDELARIARENDAEAKTSASAIARLSVLLDKERARSAEFVNIMGAMKHEFNVLNATAITLAERAGVTSAELVELKRMWAKISAEPVHAELGLHQSAPEFLVKAARVAYRKAYHPDTKPEQERRGAEMTFKRNEASFDRLYQMRGLSK